MQEKRQQRYAQHLHYLSNDQLGAMLGEYNINDPYLRLQEICQTLLKFCEQYPPKIERQKLITTIERRLYAYMQDIGKDRSSFIAQLEKELKRVEDLRIDIILPRELNGQIVNVILDIYRSSNMEKIDDRLGINRRFLLEQENKRRSQMIPRGMYLNRCVDFLIAQTGLSEVDSCSMTDDNIIKAAHIIKYRQINCGYCHGQISFDKMYRSVIRRQLAYIDHDHPLDCQYWGIIVNYFIDTGNFNLDINTCPCTLCVLVSFDPVIV